MLVDGILDGVIYEFLGNYWHGNPKVFDPNTINKRAGISFGELYKRTFEKLDKLTEHGYKAKYIWEYDWQQFKAGKVSSPNIQEHIHA